MKVKTLAKNSKLLNVVYFFCDEEFRKTADYQNLLKKIKNSSKILDNLILIDKKIAENEQFENLLAKLQGDKLNIYKLISNEKLEIVSSYINKLNGNSEIIKTTRILKKLTFIDEKNTFLFNIHIENNNSPDFLKASLEFMLQNSLTVTLKENLIEFSIPLDDLSKFCSSWIEFESYILNPKQKENLIKQLLGLKKLEYGLKTLENNDKVFYLKSEEFKDEKIKDFLTSRGYEENLSDNELTFKTFPDLLKFCNTLEKEKLTNSKEIKKNINHIITNHAEENTVKTGSDLNLELHNNSILINHNENSYFFNFDLGNIQLSQDIKEFSRFFNEQNYFRHDQTVKLSENGKKLIFFNYPIHNELFNYHLDVLYTAQISWHINNSELHTTTKVTYRNNKPYVIISDAKYILGTTNVNSEIDANNNTVTKFGRNHKYLFCLKLSKIEGYKNLIEVVNSDQNDYRLAILPNYGQKIANYIKLISQFLKTFENFELIYNTILEALPNDLKLSTNLGFHSLGVELEYSQNNHEYFLQLDLGHTLDLQEGKLLNIKTLSSQESLIFSANNKINIQLNALEDSEKIQQIKKEISDDTQVTTEEIPETVISDEARTKHVNESKFNFSEKLNSIKSTLSNFRSKIKNKFKGVGEKFKNPFFLTYTIIGAICLIAVLSVFVWLAKKIPSPFDKIVSTVICLAGGALLVGVCYKQCVNNEDKCHQ